MINRDQFMKMLLSPARHETETREQYQIRRHNNKNAMKLIEKGDTTLLDKLYASYQASDIHNEEDNLQETE